MCMRLIEYLSKPPGEYNTSHVLKPCVFVACSMKFAQKAWSILSHDRATDICLRQTQHIVLYNKEQEPETLLKLELRFHIVAFCGFFLEGT